MMAKGHRTVNCVGGGGTMLNTDPYTRVNFSIGLKVKDYVKVL